MGNTNENYDKNKLAEQGEIPEIIPSEYECQFEFITQPKTAENQHKPFLDIMNVEKELLNPDDALKDVQFNSPDEA